MVKNSMVDTDIKFIVKPNIDLIVSCIVFLVAAVTLFIYDGRRYLLLVIFAAVSGFGDLVFIIAVRVYVYKHGILVRNCLMQTKWYLFSEVYTEEIVGGESIYAGRGAYKIIDAEGKTIVVIGEKFSNYDDLKKIIDKKNKNRKVQYFDS